jgi:hypothetical protein
MSYSFSPSLSPSLSILPPPLRLLCSSAPVSGSAAACRSQPMCRPAARAFLPGGRELGATGRRLSGATAKLGSASIWSRPRSGRGEGVMVVGARKATRPDPRLLRRCSIDAPRPLLSVGDGSPACSAASVSIQFPQDGGARSWASARSPSPVSPRWQREQRRAWRE